MQPTAAIAQIRTMDLAGSIRFYTDKLGLVLVFQYEDFYAGVRAGSQMVHLKRVDKQDPSINYVAAGEHFHLYLELDDVAAYAAALKRSGVTFVHELQDKPWGMREFVIEDDQGHTIYCGGPV